MVGRRAADQVLTPRLRVAAVVALAVAVVGGAVLLHLFRADGFEQERALAAPAPPASAPPAAVAEVAQRDPREVTTALRAADRARQLLARGEVKAALTVLGSAVHALPENAELAHVHGTALWRFGTRDRALFELQRAVRLSPQSEIYREGLARALQAMGRPGAAARLLYGPPMPLADAEVGQDGAPPVSLEAKGDLGGAGDGGFKGRRSFTDEDLRGRVHAPVTRESPR